MYCMARKFGLKVLYTVSMVPLYVCDPSCSPRMEEETAVDEWTRMTMIRVWLKAQRVFSADKRIGRVSQERVRDSKRTV